MKQRSLISVDSTRTRSKWHRLPSWSSITPLRPFGVVRISATALIFGASLMGQGYLVTDLGTLPNAGDSSATAINSAGQVIGSAVDGGSQRERAFIWAAGSKQEIMPGSPYSVHLSGINSKGEVVGYRSNASCFIWTPSSVREIALPGALPESCTAINEAGEVAYNTVYNCSNCSSHTSWLWRNGTINDPGGGPAYTLNNRSERGGSIYTGAGQIASLLYGSTEKALPSISGDPGANSYVQGMNDFGQIVGRGHRAWGYPEYHAALWQNRQAQDLGTLAGLVWTARAAAQGINSSGTIVGASDTVNGRTHAFVYQNGLMSDLNSMIPFSPDWELVSATSINDSGQIVGWGLHGTGSRAFLLTPTSLSSYPDHGGNAGRVTVRMRGLAGQSGVHVRLVGPGFVDIVAESVQVVDSYAMPVLSVTFNLTGAIPGSRSVVLTFSGSQSLTLPTPFEITTGTPSEMWLDIGGRAVIRGGKQQSYQIAYGSRGADAGLTRIWVSFPSFFSWLVPSGYPLASSGTQGGFAYLAFDVYPTTWGSGFVPILLTLPDQDQYGHGIFPISAWVGAGHD